MLIVLLLTSGLITGVLANAAKGFAIRLQLVDVPNARSSHQLPTPRLGGMAIALTFLLCWSVWLLALQQPVHETWIVVGAMAAGTVGLIDDLRSVRPATKLLGQATGVGLSFMVATYLQGLHLGTPWMLGTSIWIIGFSSAFNFMDGSDGLAAGCAAVFAISLGTLSSWHSPAGAVVVPWIVVAVSLGFLMMNFAPASIFMGDGGSLFLGALLGGLAADAVNQGASSVSAALAVGPFVFDAMWTLLRRIRRREPILMAHRSHLYQRLLIAGRSHRFVACLYYAWSSGCGLLALAYDRTNGAVRIVLLAIGVSTVVGALFFVRHEERRTAS